MSVNLNPYLLPPVYPQLRHSNCSVISLSSELVTDGLCIWMLCKLPPEITDVIIDYLHDDKQSLLACNQICRQWRPACRYHLFSKIEVIPQNLNRLLEILRFQACVATVVQHVDIGIYNPSLQDLVIASLPIIFRFPNLRSLKLKWIEFLRRPLEDLSALSNLQHIELFKVVFFDLDHFLRFIYSIPCLQSLSIPRGIYFTSHSIYSAKLARYFHPPGHPSFHFSELDLGSNQHFGAGLPQWILSLTPMPPVNKLRLVGMVTTTFSQPLLRLVGPSLETLELISHSNIGEGTSCSEH